MRTVFHVSTPDQLSYVDAKVRNLLDDESVSIDHVAVVLDTPAVIDAAAERLREKPTAVLDDGGAVRICSNAASGASSDVEHLPSGVERVPSGVGELTRLQSEGYAYVRP